MCEAAAPCILSASAVALGASSAVSAAFVSANSADVPGAHTTETESSRGVPVLIANPGGAMTRALPVVSVSWVREEVTTFTAAMAVRSTDCTNSLTVVVSADAETAATAACGEAGPADATSTEFVDTNSADAPRAHTAETESSRGTTAGDLLVSVAMMPHSTDKQ